MTIYKTLRNFAEKYERVMLPGTLILGLIVDVFTFRSISIKSAFILLALHAISVGFMIAFINIFDLKPRENRKGILRYLRIAGPFLIQFDFGALLSATLIFYWFSGSIAVSWPFIIIVAVLMASNDVLRHHFTKPAVQLSVYFFVLFSLFSITLPFIFNSISVWLFILSSVLSSLFIAIYAQVLAKYVPEVKSRLPVITSVIMTIILVLNTFYFLNFIPPVPLSLREVGVYHNVERTGGDYKVLTEKESFINKILPGRVILIMPGERVYFYTSIFAPADLNTEITHNWQFYNTETKKWEDRNQLSFTVTGGRQEGYRGFSYKTNTEAGAWRVSVETKRGQVLGQINFKIGYVNDLPELITEFK